MTKKPVTARYLEGKIMAPASKHLASPAGMILSRKASDSTATRRKIETALSAASSKYPIFRKS